MLISLSYLLFSLSDSFQSNRYLSVELTVKKYPTCQEQTRFVYIKMIKCASTTLSDVFRRFGILRNLSFVLPPKDRIYIGWPYPIDETFYRPPAKSSAGFDILCDHAVYNAENFKKIMGPGTVYIMSLREPFSQFKSMTNYYNILNISGVPWNVTDRFSEYLNNFEHYEATYKSHEASPLRYCIPDGFSMMRNLMSFNLGFPTGGFLSLANDKAADSALIYHWITDELEEQFQFVIIVEYFHESIVLLRRQLCWKLQDILFRTSNSLTYDYKLHADPRHVAMYRKWSRVDYALYEHFNNTLWKRILEEDDSFWVEVEYFRRVNIDVNDFCYQLKSTLRSSETLHIDESDWNEAFEVTAEFCQLLNGDLLKLLQTKYEEQLEVAVSEKQPSMKTC
jgi:hypothetical protein